MSIWDWIHEFLAEAEANGDEERLELIEHAHRASDFGKEEPDLNLAALNEGRALAQRLQEPWWILFFDHWRLQVLLHYKRDYREVLDIAVKATLEARKPTYAQFPQRVCLHEDLINAYLGIDPLGHQDAIASAMDYMNDEIPEDVECQFCARSCRTEFELVRGQLEEAEKSAKITLEMADDYWNPSTAEHHSGAACAHLCTIAYQRKDWAALQEWATLGEELNRNDDDDLGLATQMLWLALVARSQGDSDRAKRLRHRAVSKVKRVRSIPSSDYYDALAAYHEYGGELDKAVRVRERELARINGKGRYHDEAQAQLKRCTLLSTMGQLEDAQRQECRESVEKLRDPSPWIQKLDALK